MQAVPPGKLVSARDHLVHNRIAAAELEIAAHLEQQPDDLLAKTLLAVVWFKSNRLEDSEKLLEDVLGLEPNQLDATGLLAIIKKTKNDFSSAAKLFERIVDLGRPSADLYNQIGICRLNLGDAVSAGRAFKKAIELDRSVAHSYYNLGLALKEVGRSYETFSTFRRGIEVDPSFLDGYVQLWEQMRHLLNWKEGLPILELGLRKHPDSIKLMTIVASTYGKVGRPKDAENLYRSASKLHPSGAPPYAYWLQQEGRFEDSIPILKEMLAADPIQGQAYYNLAIAKCFEINGNSLIDVATDLTKSSVILGEERMFLHYAIAKAFEHEKDYGSAMHNYDVANCEAYSLYNSDVSPDLEATAGELLTLGNLYSRQKIEDFASLGSKSAKPIFIVGMIRTGTTLLDQILSSHRHIRSAGEQPFWQITSGRTNLKWTNSGPDGKDIEELASRYLKALDDATGGAKRVTDKMPINFIHMGLMTVVFPRAKFIHIRRNPVDTCLSIYTTFLGSGTKFAYNQENIVAYYQAYMDTMAFWRTVLPPGRMIEIDYEDLVANKAVVIKEVLDFCGLEWDDAVLSHEKNQSQVSTPSLWTARQPVNAGSVERWRKYEPWLGKLLELQELSHPPASSESI